MELLIGLFALFWFCFGSLIVFKALSWGAQLCDRLLTAFGQFLKMALKQTARGLFFLIRYAFSWIKKPEHTTMTIRSIVDSPAELMHMRNQHLLQSSGKRAPVVIEYSQPKRK